jgi:hypothetical protein
MKKYDNIFLTIDYENAKVIVNLNKPFISYLHYYYIMHSNHEEYVNWNIDPLWSFEFLVQALKSYCSPTELKEFLKEYPDFIGYLI